MSDECAYECPEGCKSVFSDPVSANEHARKVHHRGGSRVKFYYLVRHVKSTLPVSVYPATRQIVCHGTSEAYVESQLEKIQSVVQMPAGCTYSIECY